MASSEEDVLLVHAYLDGELDVSKSLEVERKISACANLQLLARDITALKGILSREHSPDPLPERLQDRIETAIGVRYTRRTAPPWLLLAASLALVIGSLSIPTLLRYQTSYDPYAEMIDGHLRSLMSSQLTDVRSSDQHTVKPWFNGRIPQSPRVVDLSEQGYELLGARIDVFANTPVPTLVYRRRQHVISFTELNDRAELRGASPKGSTQGFNVVTWAEGNRSFVAVSDLNRTELETFARLIQARNT